MYACGSHQVLPYAISVLQEAGYKLVTVAECLGGLDTYRKVSEPQKPDVSPFNCSLLMLLTYLLQSLIGTAKYTGIGIFSTAFNDLIDCTLLIL